MSYANIENKFFGRSDILDHLRRRIVDLKDGYRQNIAILGDRYIGKSSILTNFAMNLDDNNVVIVYLDLENKDFNYFFSKFVGSLLYNYSKSEHLDLHNDINLLLESTKEKIPNTVQVIKKIRQDLGKKKMSACFLGLMTLPEVFTNETGKFCILIFDEFQFLDSLNIPDVFQSLGKKIMTQKRCFYIMSSSFISAAEKILSEKLSLLFGNFENIIIDSFDIEDCQHFINKHLDGVRIGGQLSSFLADFTGGHPLYLNLLCREMLSLSSMHRQEEVYLPLLSQAIENTLFDKWGVISRHFDLIINEICEGKDSGLTSSLLISLSNNNNKVTDLIENTDINKSKVKLRINKLMDAGIIEKNSNFYYFKDKLFKYWIKFVYQRRLNDVELAPDRIRRHFKEEFQCHVDIYKSNARKDLSVRITELLNCFDNEAFNLNGRRYRIPAFRKIEEFKAFNDNGTYYNGLRASSDDDSIWLIFLKKDGFGEKDFNFISKEAKNLGKRPDKCLIISLSDMDESVRVKALQERFWIWNKREINTLLTLFDKPFI